MARSIVVPGGGARLRLQLPPVRPDAESVEPLEHARDRIVVDRPVLAGDDLDHQLAPDGARGVEDAEELALLARLQIVADRPGDRSTGT